MSPRDRRGCRLLENDRRELLAYKETLCQSLQRSYDMPSKLLDKIVRVEEAIREDEEALAALGIKYDLNGGES